jgi:hypothetical protein
MLQNPFPHMALGRLYTGDEPGFVWNPWLLNHHKNPRLQQFFRRYAAAPLLNAGLLGGSVDVVIEFCGHMIRVYGEMMTDESHGRYGPGLTDMGVFNYVARTFFGSRVVHGKMVNTTFKANERNTVSWFKHK